MSNLGGYKVLTTLAKKVGGPRNLVILIAGSGAIAYAVVVKAGKFVIKKGEQVIIKRKEKKNNYEIRKDVIYTVDRDVESNEGLELKVGDRFKVLECDGDDILIELIGNDNNPYFVSGELLKEISNYSDRGNDNNHRF